VSDSSLRDIVRATRAFDREVTREVAIATLEEQGYVVVPPLVVAAIKIERLEKATAEAMSAFENWPKWMRGES
jgi:hypothetical protein